MTRNRDKLLEVRGLRVCFRGTTGMPPAVDGVDLSIRPGQTVALVGESGSGKTVTALSIMRLIPRRIGEICGGKILFRDGLRDHPVNLLDLDERAMRRMRGARISMVFQEPAGCLNPVLSVGEQIVEALRLHRGLRGRLAWRRAAALLDQVGIAASGQRVRGFPHQLSGGMQQRVMIAMALACEPALLIADEPTSALDVTVQAQIMELLGVLHQSSGMAMLLITHDMGVAAQMADRVCVMSAGRIVESGPAERVFARPQHASTQRLLQHTLHLGDVGGRSHA